MKRKALFSAIIIACIMSFTACNNKSEPKTATEQQTATADASGDATKNKAEAPTPKSDFYGYVNSKWLSETKIPKDSSSINNFFQLEEKTTDSIQAMLKELNDNYGTLAEGSDEKKLIDFYNMAKDFKTRDEQGVTPIKPLLDKIRVAKNVKELNKFVFQLMQEDINTVFDLTVDQDTKDSTNNILYFDSPIIGMSKSQLEKTDDFSVKNQAAYKEFMKELFILSGIDEKEAEKKAELVYNFEKEIAASQLSEEEQKNVDSLYNLTDWDKLKKFAPNLPLMEAAKLLKMDGAKKIVCLQPNALKKANELYTDENIETLKSFIEIRYLNKHKTHLSKAFIEANEKFNAVSSGVYNVKPDEKLAFELLDEIFSNLIGKVYVEKNFMSTAKADVIEMVNDVKNIYVKRIKALDWMTEKTKNEALKKLDTMAIKIGYPDKWEDYSMVNIKTFENGGNIVSNIAEVRNIRLDETAKKLNIPPNKMEWSLGPQVVNAYYNPLNNEIVFPAAILQPPFYNPKASKEDNLGGIGAVIGHEISHAFDAKGAQFDEKGNVKNWWQDEDYKKFQEKVQKAADAYSKLEVVPGYFVNGEISTGEILADLGGVTVIIDIANEKGYDTKKIFEAYAKVWRELKTNERFISDLEDPHPPGKFRVNNIVNQIEQFYKDFDVKEGDPMYVKPEDRLTIW